MPRPSPPVTPSQPTLTQAKWLHKRQRSRDGSIFEGESMARDNSSVHSHTGASVTIDNVKFSELTTDFLPPATSYSGGDSDFEESKSKQRRGTKEEAPNPDMTMSNKLPQTQ